MADITDITSILDIYNENKYNDRVHSEIIGASLVPRTVHPIDKAIDDLALSPSIPVFEGFLSQKEVRKKLFVDEAAQDDYPAFHGSDLEQESEDYCVPSLSDSSLDEPLSSLSKVGISMAADHSLTRVIAFHIYADQNRFARVEEDIMKHEFEVQSESCFLFDRLRQNQVRQVLQVVSNIYSIDIHFSRANSLNVVEIISPVNSLFIEKKGRPLRIVQIGNQFIYKPLEIKKKIAFNLEVDGSKKDRGEDSWKKEFAATFAKGQNWSEEDERTHQLLKQGPASIEDLNAYEMEKKSNETDDEEEFHDLPNLPNDGDQGGLYSNAYSGLELKVKSRSFSPVLSRKSLPAQTNDSFDRTLEEAIERAINL